MIICLYIYGSNCTKTNYPWESIKYFWFYHGLLVFVCVLTCAAPWTHNASFQGCHAVRNASLYGNWLPILWKKCTSVFDWHMFDPSLCHWEATNCSVSVCVCGWGCMCANATDPKRIGLIFEGFQAALGSCMHVCLYLLSCGPHAEFNRAARKTNPMLRLPMIQPVLLERERESDGEKDNDLVYQEHDMEGSEGEK